jgi:hypothetical protein
MMVQDQYSGHIHEVPEPYGMAGLGEPVYDGLGNPVGFIGPIFDAIKNVASNIPIVGGILNNLLPGGQQAPPRPPSPMQSMFPQGFPSPFPSGMPGLSPFMQPFRPPWPMGWGRPPLPYTGLGPRRLYMRCAVWPGPRGLTPDHAANMAPLPPPGTPGAPVMPGFPGMGHRRRRRRR